MRKYRIINNTNYINGYNIITQGRDWQKDICGLADFGTDTDSDSLRMVTSPCTKSSIHKYILSVRQM